MNQIGALEAILFAYGEEGVTKDEIGHTFNLKKEELDEFIHEFIESYNHEQRGIECVMYGNVLKLISKKEHHDIIATLMHFDKTRQLSQAALETLAIIAYRQPITRLEIEEIRGVNSDMMCRRLEAMDLITEAGRAESIGRPILYKVTPAFMDVFKLQSLQELPEINFDSMEEEHELFK